MARTPVLLWRLPLLLVDILTKSLGDQPDLVPMRSDEAGGLARAVVQTHADVVIVGADQSLSGDHFESLFEEYPRLKVFSVSRDGKSTVFHEMRPQRASLGELSPAGLLAAIRQALHSTARTPSLGGSEQA